MTVLRPALQFSNKNKVVTELTETRTPRNEAYIENKIYHRTGI
jgi:hypothetical protein